MRRIKDILEQHREKGRFKPVVPRYVPSVAVVSPRPSSDSADVKLKEDGGLAQNTLLDKKKKPMSPASAEISFQSVKEMDTSMKEAKDEKECGYEGAMAMNQLKTITRHAEYLMEMMKPDTDLPEWVQSKITLAADYIQTACDYMTSEMDEAVNAAQQAAIAINMKKKGIKPKNEQVEELEEMDKSQDPPGRDGGIQFPPGPKVSKKDIKAVKKDPAKHLSDLLAKEYAKKKITDKSGAVHTPMSRARHLARMAMQKQMTKPVKESLEESRKAQIVREAMKSAKDKMKKTVADEDKFVANPELNSKVIKTASQM